MQRDSRSIVGALLAARQSQRKRSSYKPRQRKPGITLNMPEKIDIAVVGATGVVGESILAILKEREFPVGTVYALASIDSPKS